MTSAPSHVPTQPPYNKSSYCCQIHNLISSPGSPPGKISDFHTSLHDILTADMAIVSSTLQLYIQYIKPHFISGSLQGILVSWWFLHRSQWPLNQHSTWKLKWTSSTYQPISLRIRLIQLIYGYTSIPTYVLETAVKGRAGSTSWSKLCVYIGRIRLMEVICGMF